MYRRNNGGWNRRCGQIEKTPRIDSFEAGALDGWDTLFASGNGRMAALDGYRYIEYTPQEEREFVEIWHPQEGWSETLTLSRKANGFGGSQPFFLCPACGERRRYLYLTGATFLCRRCAELNYKSQQETRSGSMYYYGKGMELAEKHLDAWPRVRPDGFAFCDWVPDRPRYMHRAAYRRYLARFMRYRKKHADRQIADMLRLLKMFK